MLQHITDQDINGYKTDPKDPFAVEFIDGVITSILNTYEPIAIAFMNGSDSSNRTRPEYEAAARALNGQVKFYELNSLEHPTMTEEHSIETFPTLILIKDNDEIAVYKGHYLRGKLIKRIQKALDLPRPLGDFEKDESDYDGWLDR